MKQITEIHFDYKAAMSDGKEVYSEDWNTAKIGEKGVSKITEHSAMGPGDIWFYDIEYDNGETTRIFHPYKVFFKNIDVE